MTDQEYQEAFDAITSHGWLSFSEGRLLIETAERTTGDMVEVGSYYGRSAMLLGHLAVRDNRTLYCVDPWDDNFSTDRPGQEILDIFLRNTERYGEHVVPVRTRVEDWETRPAGFVYLDGDHTYEGTLAQINKALSCNPQFIAVHDVSNSQGGRLVTDACLKLLGKWTELVDTLAVWRHQKAWRNLMAKAA